MLYRNSAALFENLAVKLSFILFAIVDTHFDLMFLTVLVFAWHA